MKPGNSWWQMFVAILGKILAMLSWGGAVTVLTLWIVASLIPVGTEHVALAVIFAMSLYLAASRVIWILGPVLTGVSAGLTILVGGCWFALQRYVHGTSGQWWTPLLISFLAALLFFLVHEVARRRVYRLYPKY